MSPDQHASGSLTYALPMTDSKIPGRTGGDPKPYVLDWLDRDIIRLELRGDVDMRRYVPEVMSLCARLDIKEPPWMDDEAIRERSNPTAPNGRAGTHDRRLGQRSGMSLEHEGRRALVV
jgi:hypothetical protein